MREFGYDILFGACRNEGNHYYNIQEVVIIVLQIANETKLWNDLPLYIKQSESIAIFEKEP